MITGISLSETKDFVSSFDSGEPKTIWKLGILDAEVFASLGQYNDNPLKMMLEIVKFGLKGFENFTDSAGNKVNFNTISRSLGPYPYKVVSDSIIKVIPSKIINELGGEILSLSKLSEEETKNS